MNSVGKCSLCDYVGDNTHIHHIIPRSRGGSDEDGNLIELCTICHGKVHNVSFYDNKGLVSSKIAQTKTIDKECLSYLNDIEDNLHDFIMEYYYEYNSNVSRNYFIKMPWVYKACLLLWNMVRLKGINMEMLLETYTNFTKKITSELTLAF